MAYYSMKKLIENENVKLNNSAITQEEYESFKVRSMKKLDIFLACDRLTSSQYSELVSLLEKDSSDIFGNLE